MSRVQHTAVAVLMGVSLSLLGGATTSAQEVPTGAARIIEKVQTRIFISQANLGFHVDAILENQPTPGE